MTTIKLGSSGNDVKLLQFYLDLTIDGEFGPKTDSVIKNWQSSHGLVADGVVGPKTWNKIEEVYDVSIEYNPIDIHISKEARAIKYIVIHFTAGASSKPGSAMGVRNVFLKRAASADYAIDDTTIAQFNPDPKNYYCWSVGDGKGVYGISNKNSISIEICSNIKKLTSTQAANHSGWYFTEDSLNQAVKLTKFLMKKYNIDIDHVVRHYDASHKLCPGLIGWNDGEIYDATTGKRTTQKNTSEKWLDFKKKL